VRQMKALEKYPELRRREERLRLALEAIGAGEWELNLADRSIYHSSRFDSIFGYQELSPDWSYGLFLEHVWPEDRHELNVRLEQAIESRQELNFECRIVRRDGRRRWVRVCGRHNDAGSGTPGTLVGVIEDITGRKHAEETTRRSESEQRTSDGRLLPVGGVASCVEFETEEFCCGFIREYIMPRTAEAVLRESSPRFRVAFETIPEGAAITLLEDGLVIDVNSGFSDITGYAQGEVVGKSTLAVPLWHDPKERLRFVDTVTAKGVVHNLEVKLRHKDGRTIIASLSGRILRSKEESFLFTFFKDVTAQKRAEESLLRLNRALRVLTSCNEVLVRAENETNLLHDICRVIIDEGGYHFAWVGYAENDEDRTVRPVSYAGHEDGYLATLNISWADTVRGHGPTGTAIRTGRPSYINDLQNETTFAIWRDEASRRSYRSSLAIPLISSEQRGCLNIYASEPDAFDAEEIDLMARLANDLAYGIASLRTRERHCQASDALMESFEEYRKLAAERDQERHLLRALIDSIPDLIFFKDPESLYLGCNKTFEEYAGRPEQDLIGLSDSDILPQEVGENILELDRQVLDLHVTQHSEAWSHYPDGRQVLLETLKTPYCGRDGQILGLIGISRDITERYRAEEAIRNSEELLRKVFDSIPDLLVVVDPDLRILKSNWRWRETFADSLDQNEKPYCYDVFFYGQGGPCDFCQVREVIRTGASVFRRFFNERTNTHREIRAYPVFDESGNVTMVVEHLRDITELKRAEDERTRLKEQLHQAHKMEALGQFAGGIAHDFNNYLTAIIGCSQLILNKLAGEPLLKSYADMIVSSGEKAAGLTSSLLAFSRKQAMEKKVVDVNQTIAKLSKLLKILVSEDIEFKTELCAIPLAVRMDEGQMEQVLMNLTTNARDAMPDGGRIVVRTEPRILEHEFKNIHGMGKPGEYAIITFSDTGVGIPDEARQMVFEPFFTTKGPEKGTGLGLSIIHDIVRQNGGYLDLESTPGEGTRFLLYLPLAVGNPDREKSTNLPARSGRGAATVLLAEDEPTVRRFVSMTLEEQGYRVIETSDGEEAVSRFSEHRAEIDLAILDVVMPKKNGGLVSQEIRRLRPDVGILFMSGYTADLISRTLLSVDNEFFIQKPLRPHDIMLKVAQVLERHQGTPDVVHPMEMRGGAVDPEPGTATR